MYDWVPIAIAIVAFSAISGGLRRRIAPLPHEKRISKKGALIHSVGTIVLFIILLFVGLAVLGSMAGK
jgi:hypothetical protein